VYISPKTYNMIIGIFLRNFKTYSATNYIPISNGENFNGLLGDNGMGKSSVLEALNCLFNNTEFIYNTSVNKQGKESAEPGIIPIFLIGKDSEIFKEHQDFIESYSEYCWNLTENKVQGNNQGHLTIVRRQIEILVRNGFRKDYYFLPIGINYRRHVELSIFNFQNLAEAVGLELEDGNQKITEEALLQSPFSEILQSILDYFEYLYIPKDIDTSAFTSLENKHVQGLMGKTLVEIVEEMVPKKEIERINTNLNKFLSTINDIFGDYTFRTAASRQQMIRKASVYNLIIEDFFKTRRLNKNLNGHWLEVGNLSSGEKQKAIIDITRKFLETYRKSTRNIILGIDEPEASLHMSACFEQFNSLYEMSRICSQLLFTTHWYGFIPTVTKGNVTVITKEITDRPRHVFDLISVANYREEIKQDSESSKGILPYDIRLKSLNDFIQSIISSIINPEPFNWLLCEGSSEKKYFESYFAEEIKERRLRIIPVGGAPQIKRIYQNLVVTYEDYKRQVQGKVLLLMDTDAKVVEFETINNANPNLKCFRIVNDIDKKDARLVDVHDNLKSPKTELEDVLCGKTFYETLQTFSPNDEIDKLLGMIDSKQIDNKSVYFSLDMSPAKQSLLDSIFNHPGMKFEFAKRYNKINETEDPEWITEIKRFFAPNVEVEPKKFKVLTQTKRRQF
jgi:predicted ATPase